MKTINGFSINFDFSKLIKVADLIYHDGPLLSHYVSNKGENWLSGNIWLVSFKISYLCLPLFYETRTTPSCHPSGCAYRQL